MQINEKLTVTAPAKLNLHLAVLDRRADGFHNLDSIFLAMDFGDILHFFPVENKELTEITTEWAYEDINTENIPVEKNLIFKALSLFREKTRFLQGIRVKVEKRIPVGSGLGGGSSDAAAALLAVNKLAGFPLTREELLKLACSLGSDVPFFIYETAAARVSGRGEIITPMDAPYRFFVLVNPGFSSNTADAFKLLDKYREKNPVVKSGGYYNDFLDCFHYPEKSVYNAIIAGLRQLGADFASLSGSGSACFGCFKEKQTAQKAADVLRGEWKFAEYCGILNASRCER